jgi:hypothetical protein
MARAETVTKLPLDTWARIMGINPLHFNQVQFGDPEAGCDEVMVQHEWQKTDAIGREAVARAIAEAEAEIEKALHFHLLPTWDVDEWQRTVRPYDKQLFNLNSTDLRGYQQIVRPDWRHFITGGVEAKTLIEAGAAIVWSDADGDGYEETGTVAVATTVTDECEIAAYYPGKSGADEWQIRPISVSIAAGVATITFRRELCVQEALLEDMEPAAVAALDDANFLDELDVYRHWNDPQTQVLLQWENLGCECGSSSCPICSNSTQAGCLNARGELRRGIVSYAPATWDAAEENFSAAALAVGRQPDIVRLWYRSGFRDRRKSCPTLQMADQWGRTVAYFAASKLDRPICACTKAQIDKWTQDLAYQTGAEQLSQFQITDRILNNPFGTTAGALYAWKQVMAAGGTADVVFA